MPQLIPIRQRIMGSNWERVYASSEQDKTCVFLGRPWKETSMDTDGNYQRTVERPLCAQRTAVNLNT